MNHDKLYIMKSFRTIHGIMPLNLCELNFKMRIYLCFLCLTMASVYCGSGRQGQYSNEWLLEGDVSKEEAKDLANSYGFEYSHEVLGGYHVLKVQSTGFNSARSHALSNKQKRMSKNSKVKTMKQLKYLHRERRSQVNSQTIHIADSSWPDMWYFHPDRVPNMYVYEVWEMGYSGAGINIAVLDDGIDMGHPDLMGNYISDYSYDYLYENKYPVHNDGDFHGTWCAGIISAVKNEECIVGVAYNSKFSAIKTMDSFLSLTPAGEAMSLIHELSHFDIYSISWGPSDDGQTFEGPVDVVNAALLKGVTEGRNGKGVIYTWAAGNGGGNYDNCNCDGFVGSIYTISITSISMDLKEAWYAERCTSIMVGTYGGDTPHPAVSTTDTAGRCTKTFQGTSATCPMATGIIAMVLEANPDLTWRDVQHLIVETASHNGLNHSTALSGSGRHVNHYFGFGLMNAEAMINQSLDWKTVPDQMTCQSSNISVNGLSVNGSVVTSEHVSDGCSHSVRYLEHVQARVVVQSVWRGDLEIFLTSPSGLESQLLTSRPRDRERMKLDWTFMTVHHWGENPDGKWQLRVQTTEPDRIFTVYEWQLILFGTTTDPTLGRRKASDQSSVESSNEFGEIVGGAVGGVILLAVVMVTVAVLIYCRPPQKVMDNTKNAKERTNNTSVDGPGPSTYLSSIYS